MLGKDFYIDYPVLSLPINSSLKGALLFLVWTGQYSRPTKDLDLLCLGKSSDEYLKKVFEDICQVNVEKDGLHFDLKSISIVDIQQDEEYKGKRIKVICYLGKARIPLQIDIGFCGVIIPKSIKTLFPVLLEFPAPQIYAYPKETVIAEKLQAMIFLGIRNSRMKDFYDIHVMMNEFHFLGDLLVQSIRATFKRRDTPLPDQIPFVFTEDYAKEKQIQWQAFLRKTHLNINSNFFQIIDDLGLFLTQPLDYTSKNKKFLCVWNKGGPWKETGK